ncbi:MAG: N-acetylmuramoyl-L-alanine amidase [Myxococcota bacterium]|nr:N-acetylmuramoyl-L-alanine amidase [Myxococcota bacterium]
MRYFVLLLALCLLTSPSLGKRKRARKAKLKYLKHVVVDPGHGGTNPGTPGAHGVFEKYVTLPISLAIEAELKRRTNAKVTLTRRDDSFLGLGERAVMANTAGGDIFLSIHCNASTSGVGRGVEVYFLSAESAKGEIAKLVAREDHGAGDDKAEEKPKNPLSVEQVLKDATMFKSHELSQKVAETIASELGKALKAKNRGVFQAPFGVLKRTEMPAVVVEVGYLSHPIEGKRLLQRAYQRKIAKGIVRAILSLDKSLSGKRRR